MESTKDKDIEINKKSNQTLDILKFIAAILIVGAHCLPVFANNILNVYYGQWFFRFCVPLFFISSGYYFAKFNDDKRKKYILRILLIYLLSMLLYSPVYLDSMIKSGFNFWSLFRTLFFGYHHLWYLSALFYALTIWYLFSKVNFFKAIYFKCKYLIFLVLLLAGVLFDEYFALFNLPLLTKVAGGLNFAGGGDSFGAFPYQCY